MSKEPKNIVHLTPELPNREKVIAHEDSSLAKCSPQNEHHTEQKADSVQHSLPVQLRGQQAAGVETRDQREVKEGSHHEVATKLTIVRKDRRDSRRHIAETDACDVQEQSNLKMSSGSPQSRNMETPASQATPVFTMVDAKKTNSSASPILRESQPTHATLQLKPTRSNMQAPAGISSEEQKKKKDKLSIIEDIKLEFHGDELHIINNLNEDIDIPLDSLKVSTIHDISKNIQDKLNLDPLDHEELLLLESKLGRLALT